MKKLLLKFAWFLALSLPILIFLKTMAFNTNGILYGDWDYFAQAYEAARRSILEFHQFPWLNPWVAGGVPLYANPQFGLFSIQMPLVLLFGTLAGLHLAVLVYFLAGFWGMYCLLKRLGAEKLIAVLLSYIWIFSSFPVWRLAGGHLTFGTYLLAPWFFYFLLNIRKKYGWLWLGLYTAFLINQSMHYMTVQLLAIGAMVAIFQLVIHRGKGSFWISVKPYVLSLLLTLPLIFHKAYYTFQYMHDYTKAPPIEHGTTINMITAALTFRGFRNFDPVSSGLGNVGWSEYAAYFGILTLGLLAYFIVKNLEQPKKLRPQFVFVVVGLVILLLISLGNFSAISPYGLIHRLPVFDQMQVSARWLGWFALGAIVLLARLPRKPVIVLILLLSALDVFQSSYSVINQNLGDYQEPSNKTTQIQQLAYPTYNSKIDLTSMRLFYATQANKGDIYGYEPVFGFGIYKNEGYSALTNRCAANRSECDFVLSNNATVTYWSPQRIELHRIGSGDIEINVNPGSYWTVNGKDVFKYQKILELKQKFKIQDPSEHIVLAIRP